MKLNCDLGESFGNWTMGLDAEVMPYIDQANIACGFHAGDPMVMAATLALAKHHGVEIGAHPSYPDLIGFGRRHMQLSDTELTHTMHYQLAAICGMASVQGLQVSYVKPHGALYNDMMSDKRIRQSLFKAIADFPQRLFVLMQGTPDWLAHQQEAQTFGLSLSFEAFADRRYADNGALLSRQHKRALLTDTEILDQVKRFVDEQKVVTLNGNQLSFPIDSLCVHGDNPTATALIQKIRQTVQSNAV